MFHYFKKMGLGLHVGSVSDIIRIKTENGDKGYALAVVACRTDGEIGFMIEVVSDANEFDEILDELKEIFIKDGIYKYYDLVYMYPIN